MKPSFRGKFHFHAIQLNTQTHAHCFLSLTHSHSSGVFVVPDLPFCNFPEPLVSFSEGEANCGYM